MQGEYVTPEPEYVTLDDLIWEEEKYDLLADEADEEPLDEDEDDEVRELYF